jgi:hypothetical protein
MMVAEEEMAVEAMEEEGVEEVELELNLWSEGRGV